MKDIAQIAYEKYQLDWMKEHNCSLMDIINTMDGIWNDDEDKEELSPGNAFEAFEIDCGFNGSIYVCYQEFLGAEYLDEEYMKSLLSDEEFNRYQENIEKIKTDEFELE